MQIINNSKSEPVFIGFQTEREAIAHRSTNGGRVFISENGGPIIWFNYSLTPTQILKHPIQKGLSGRLS